ncbi:secreted protein [gut metagenome]|uniref:Secreted protein n=1 Tax=gut metagenome TaxID=749906 RepID=J9CWI0_9ZZZZ
MYSSKLAIRVPFTLSICSMLSISSSHSEMRMMSSE